MLAKIVVARGEEYFVRQPNHSTGLVIGSLTAASMARVILSKFSSLIRATTRGKILRNNWNKGLWINFLIIRFDQNCSLKANKLNLLIGIIVSDFEYLSRRIKGNLFTFTCELILLDKSHVVSYLVPNSKRYLYILLR